MNLDSLTAALSVHLPNVLRWGGTIARRLRHFDISLEGKSSGSSNTDALTLADLSVQELIVSALRDCDPSFRECRIEGEEETGDLECFAESGDYTIAIDPIDGTQQYRDRTGNGYAVMVNLRSNETVHYSLVYLPEEGSNGSWVEVHGNEIRCGEDDPARPAREALDGIAPVDPSLRPESPNIYLIGFQQNDASRASEVTQTGLRGFASGEMPGSIYPLLARGEFGGSLIHSPNIYDFPVSLHIARALGGDALWCHDGRAVHFGELWNDERAEMLRLPGIVACSASPRKLQKLVNLARDWSRERYAD
ncbi:MAG: inositol monophosphatase [Planctomycetaceae bacterium]|nr:inositol monophosphatase [Planctomycetaceae bacterium]